MWQCHAGCTARRVGDALRAKGLLPERPKRERKAKPKLGRIVATYDYKDAAGELVLQMVRYEPKDFRQRRPDPDKPGEWIWSIDGHPRGRSTGCPSCWPPIRPRTCSWSRARRTWTGCGRWA